MYNDNENVYCNPVQIFLDIKTFFFLLNGKGTMPHLNFIQTYCNSKLHIPP